MIPKGMTPEQRDELKDMEAKSIYMPVNKTYTLRDSFQITNLTVTDKGEIVIADFDAEDCHIHFYISRKALPNADTLEESVHYYLNNNL